MAQLAFSSNVYWTICFEFCILEQITATVLFICISSINNKRSLLRFQSTTAPTNRGWSACAAITTISGVFVFHIYYQDTEIIVIKEVSWKFWCWLKTPPRYESSYVTKYGYIATLCPGTHHRKTKSQVKLSMRPTFLQDIRTDINSRFRAARLQIN